MTDDMYEHILFDGREYATIAQVAPALKSRTLTMNGVSKAYAMTGWSLGYGGAPAALIKAMTKLQSHSTSSPSSISQAAACEIRRATSRDRASQYGLNSVDSESITTKNTH